MNPFKSRSRRTVRGRMAGAAVAGAAVAMACSVSVVALAGTAGAGTGVGASGNTVPGAASPLAPYTAGSFDSGQPIDVVVPPNSVLTPGANIFVLECSAPDGVDPTTIDSCDGDTAYGGTISVQSNGSVDVVNTSSDSGNAYPIYALPDHFSLGESPSESTTCGLGAAEECVLYIGQGGGQDIGLTAPHFFSQPFNVHSDATDSGTVNPGDGGVDTFTAPTFSSANATSFSVGATGSFTVTAGGYAPPTITESGALPAGVSFNSTTDVLSGKPTTAGTSHVSFTATNTVSSITESFTLTVLGFHISTTSPLPAATWGKNYSVTLQTLGAGSGATISWKKGSTLPKKLKLSKTGVLSGIPATKLSPPPHQSFSISVSATEKVGKVKTTVDKTLTLSIS
jgi:hypothetical protein